MGRITHIFFLVFGLVFLCASPTGAIKVGPAPQNTQDRFLPDGDNVVVRPWIENLDVPWSLIFLHDDRALVSERAGRVRLIRKGILEPSPYAVIDVAQVGEGGLMGLALHPKFPKEPYIYAMHTYREESRLFNKVIRLKDEGNRAVFDRTIIDKIPGARFHNGGRIAFGPDNMLYITTGEIFNGDLAQDLTSLGGKILRLTPQGTATNDNPFYPSPVYSYGHRNPQGLAWHPVTGDLFASEHGPSGESLVFGNDEINVIKRGGNYGWPAVAGAPSVSPYIDPIIVWKKATPPSGIVFYGDGPLKHLRGDLLIATLRSRTLIRVRLNKESSGYRISVIERWFATDSDKGRFGRIRDIVEGPDGYLYFLTNNLDGRGRADKGDDRIYRITPK